MKYITAVYFMEAKYSYASWAPSCRLIYSQNEASSYMTNLNLLATFIYSQALYHDNYCYVFTLIKT